jgi:hypothetical protein
MIRIDEWTELAEIGGYVCETFRKHGYLAIGAGCGAVAVYLEDETLSRRMVFLTDAPARQTETLMCRLGYSRKQGFEFWHPDTDISVIFSARSLSDPALPIKQWSRKNTRYGELLLLDEIQCVMELLLYSRPPYEECQSLKQAVLMAERFHVAIGALRKWAQSEGIGETFETFFESLGRDHRENDLSWQSVQKL